MIIRSDVKLDYKEILNMNERIRKLAEQAGNKRINDYYTNGTVTAFTDIQLQKFAELIVRECVEQGKKVQSQTASNGSKDYNEGREMGIEVFMNQIKKHFGVKE